MKTCSWYRTSGELESEEGRVRKIAFECGGGSAKMWRFFAALRMTVFLMTDFLPCAEDRPTVEVIML
jgi:hypothetical protein